MPKLSERWVDLINSPTRVGERPNKNTYLEKTKFAAKIMARLEHPSRGNSLQPFIGQKN
jgi:hypothetical protein